VRLWRLVSSGPGASNENSVEVTAREERLSGTGLELAPCSMVVLDWTD
jgi:hypothetical protein